MVIELRRSVKCVRYGFAIAMSAALASSSAGQEIQTEATQTPPSVLQFSTPEEIVPVQPVEASLTLAELESRALVSNPSILRASAQIGAARGAWTQVGLPPNPIVGYEGQQIGSGGLAEQHGLAVSQEIVRGGKLQLNRAVAAQDVNRREQEFAAQRQRVLTDVRVAFYQVLAAQRQIELSDELLGVGRQGFEAADALFRAKQVGRADLLQAQLEIENAQILNQNARNRHDAAWRTLTAVVGEPHLPISRLSGDLAGAPVEVAFEAMIVRLQQTSPEVAAAAFAVQRARFALERARAEPKPNVSLGGMINVIDNGIGGRPDGVASISLPLPLINRNQGGIAQAQHELRAAQQALAQLDLDLQQRLAVVYQRYADAANQAERYRSTIVPAALESLDLTRRSYGAGEVSFVGLLTAQRTYFQTNLNYLEALRELRISEAEMEGLLLSGSLQLRN